jgi:hypothetical protein
MPIGLLMLSRRWITEQQLGVALSSQRRVGYGRLGEWLIAGGATDELRVAGAIAAQWGIPLLQSEEQSRAATILLPRLLVEAYAVVPMRISGGILYLAIDQRVDPCLNLAIEKMTGLSVEPVAMSGRAFRRARQEFVDSAHPPVRHFQAASLRGLRDTVLAVAAEKQTRNFRLVRVHEYFWLRVERELEMRPQDLRSDGGGVEDCIFTYPERSAVGKPPLEN